MSELTLVYKAASHQAVGDGQMARQMLADLARAWPAFRPDLVVPRFYSDPAIAAQVLDQLTAAGWQAPG